MDTFWQLGRMGHAWKLQALNSWAFPLNVFFCNFHSILWIRCSSASFHSVKLTLGIPNLSSYGLGNGFWWVKREMPNFPMPIIYNITNFPFLRIIFVLFPLYSYPHPPHGREQALHAPQTLQTSLPGRNGVSPPLISAWFLPVLWLVAGSFAGKIHGK